MKLVDSENKCWIHTVDFSLIKAIDEKRIIGFKKNKNTENSHKEFFVGNEIFLATRNSEGKFICYGYTKIDEKFKDYDSLYDFYDNEHKFRLKRIKYFLEPIYIDDIREELYSIKSDGLLSDVLNIGYYKKITTEDKLIIQKKSSFTGLFPVYMDIITFNMKEFILDSINSLYIILKKEESRSQIEINEFIQLLQLFLESYGIDKSFKDLKAFYSRYAHELGFKHLPSRDSKKFVALINHSGEKKNFAYISLE